MHHNQGLTA